jgi:hypothetical protein
VIVYNPESGDIHSDLPPLDSPLRWSEFVDGLAKAYDARFEGQEEAAKAAKDEATAELSGSGEGSTLKSPPTTKDPARKPL